MAANVYVGGSFGRASTQQVLPSFPTRVPTYDLEDDATKIIVGVRPLEWFAVEANVIDMGEITQVARFCCDVPIVHWKQDAIGVLGVFIQQTSAIDVTMRIGIGRWNSEGTGQGMWGPHTTYDSGYDAMFGLGIQRRIGQFAVRMDFDYLSMDSIGPRIFLVDFRSPRILTIGMTWEMR